MEQQAAEQERQQEEKVRILDAIKLGFVVCHLASGLSGVLI